MLTNILSRKKVVLCFTRCKLVHVLFIYIIGMYLPFMHRNTCSSLFCDHKLNYNNIIISSFRPLTEVVIQPIPIYKYMAYNWAMLNNSYWHGLFVLYSVPCLPPPALWLAPYSSPLKTCWKPLVCMKLQEKKCWKRKMPQMGFESVHAWLAQPGRHYT